MGGPLRDRLRRFWRRSQRRIGTVGWAGIGLAAVAGACLAAALLLEDDTQQAARRLAQQQAKAAAAPRPAPAAPGEAELAAQFADTFPPFSQNGADLRLIFEAAAQGHVNLAKGDYTLQREPGSPYLAYVVNLPVHEPYPAVKQFAAAVLQALPHAALDEIRASRPDAAGGTLDATLRFTLVYRSAAGGPTR